MLSKNHYAFFVLTFQCGLQLCICARLTWNNSVKNCLVGYRKYLHYCYYFGTMLNWPPVLGFFLASQDSQDRIGGDSNRSFYRPGTHPVSQPTASKHWRKIVTKTHIISYHIKCKIYSAPITLYKTMGALCSS